MQIVVWWCRFSVLIWMQACMVASICRPGRPWPREREGPAPEVWEGFTGQNDYGRQSHPWLNMRIFFHTASSTHLQLWFFTNVLKYNVLRKCNFSRCNTFQHTFSVWCALQMPGMGFRYCRCARKCYTCSRRIWESHWQRGGSWNHPFPGVRGRVSFIHKKRKMSGLRERADACRRWNAGKTGRLDMVRKGWRVFSKQEIM